jgi:hypothetical protein
MNRITVALLAALDALIVGAIGVGIILVPLTVMWAAQFHLSVDWFVFWRAAADIWLLGHGVNLTIQLDDATAATLGLTGLSAPFQLTVAVLGFAFLATSMGVRTGLRAAATDFRFTGAVTATAVYAVFGMLIALGGRQTGVTPSLWQSIVLPGFVFGMGVALGIWYAAARDSADATHTRPLLARVGPGTRRLAASAVRGGAAAAALLLAGAAVVFAVTLVVHYATVVGLYESVQAGYLGGVAITIGQLALVPNAVLWTASWLAGPGFALGTGSSIGALGTQVGPIPSIPLLGVVPQGDPAFGFVGILVPLLAGFGAAWLLSAWYLRRGIRSTLGSALAAAVGTGVVAGAVIGLLAWWSSGAAGPGRLHTVGPDGWFVFLAVAVEVSVGAVVGTVAARRRT